MDRMFQDTRYTLRTLLRSPGFTLVAVLTLALGIGANTAIFSVVEGVLLRPLPYPEPDELVRVWQVGDDGGRMNLSHPNFVDLSEQNRTFAGMAEYAVGSVAVRNGEGWELVRFAAVSGNFFDLLGVAPIVGRGFLEEEREGALVAVVSHGYWQRVLGGTRDLTGATVSAQDATYPVVGVLPQDFEFQGDTDVFVGTPRQDGASRTAHNWRVLGRLRDGVTLAQARQDLSAIARRLKQQHGDDTWMSDATAVPLREDMVGNARTALLVLLGAAGCLLLVACANVVNLLLSRHAARRRELAVRLALGAGRARMIQQFLTESLVLALAGGMLGVLLAVWGVDALLVIEPGRLPRLDEVGVNLVVLGFAFGLSVLTAVAMALTAGFRSSRAGDVRETLASGQRTEAGGASAFRLRGALVVGEIALTIVLLVGAGLLGRSFQRLVALDPGFRTQDAVVLELTLPSVDDEADRARRVGAFDELTRRLEAIAGVEAVGGINALPLSGRGANGTFIIQDRPDEITTYEEYGRLMNIPERTGYAEYRRASGDYFRAMGIPLVRGRLFDERDGPGAPQVAVISESLARTRWPGEDPIGKLIQFGNMDGDLSPMTVVGVVGDVRDRNLEAEPEPTIYVNARQRLRGLGGRTDVVLHGAADPAAVIAAARRIVQEVAPMAPVRFGTIEQHLSGTLAERRFSLMLLGIFAALALLVAAAGLYGVISYLVTQRTREVGIRMALGAQPGDVLRMVVRQGAAMAGVGIACGIVAALVLTRFLSGMLYGVGSTDPVTFVGISVVLGAVALLASYVPARRATAVDPVVALRAE